MDNQNQDMELDEFFIREPNEIPADYHPADYQADLPNKFSTIKVPLAIVLRDRNLHLRFEALVISVSTPKDWMELLRNK